MGATRRTRKSRAATYGWWATLMCVAAAGCGKWVSFDEARGAPAGGATVIEDVADADSLDHLTLAGLIQRYTSTSADGRRVYFDYDAVRASAEARYTLDQYLGILAAVNPSKLRSTAERLAYWINGYNAAVIKTVLERYGGDRSYRAVEGDFFDGPTFLFGGTRLTINQLEHGVIRLQEDCACLRDVPAVVRTQIDTWHQELWGEAAVDPRVHAALNCSAIGCPNLLAQPPYVYRAGLLGAQLDRATRDWLDDPAKGAGPDGISRIFDWYGTDFVKSHGSVDAFIAAFRTGGVTGVDTSKFLTYDWTLNITPGS